jgi:predicted transcriptional regulator
MKNPLRTYEPILQKITRNTAMAASLTEMAKDLTMALIEHNLLAPEDMQQCLQQTHASLRKLKAHEDRSLASGESREGETTERARAIDWKKSIRKYVVECLVCGQTFKQLSARHLRQHDLDPRTYRERFGIPRTQSLAAKETTAMRRRVAHAIRPWEKAPTYQKSHEEQAPPPAPTPAPAPPKRMRKKTASTSSSA